MAATAPKDLDDGNVFARVLAFAANRQSWRGDPTIEYQELCVRESPLDVCNAGIPVFLQKMIRPTGFQCFPAPQESTYRQHQ
jgi:hypothetical protein